MKSLFRSGLIMLALGLLSACVPPLHYELVDHAANGHSISGTIITDGTMGNLTNHNILGWEYTVTGPSSWNADSNELATCIISSHVSPSETDELTIEADANSIVMSGPGFFSLWSHSNLPIPRPQYKYNNGGTRGIEPLFGNVVWDVQSVGEKVVFATRSPGSSETARRPEFRPSGPIEVCQ